MLGLASSKKMFWWIVCNDNFKKVEWIIGLMRQLSPWTVWTVTIRQIATLSRCHSGSKYNYCNYSRVETKKVRLIHLTGKLICFFIWLVTYWSNFQLIEMADWLNYSIFIWPIFRRWSVWFPSFKNGYVPRPLRTPLLVECLNASAIGHIDRVVGVE